MTNKRGWIAAVALVLGLSAVVALAQTDAVQHVIVTNLPSIYEVKGTVSVEAPIAHSDFIRREGNIVTTSRRTEWQELISVGSIDAAGFTSLTLSMQGEVKTAVPGDGVVGAILLPEEEPVLRALRDGKRLEFPIEVSCPLSKGGPVFFDSVSQTQPLAFPRYRLYLYNTAPHAVECNVYVHLKN